MRGGSPVNAMMLRMPSACAPISSACSAIRFLSREVKWISVSMPTCCRIMIASDRALIRTRAIGLSPMLMASAPASLMSCAPAMHFEGDLWTDPAVDAHDVDPGAFERLHHLARFLRAEGETIFGEGHLRDDWQVGRPLRRTDGGEQLGEIGERLQHQEIGAAFEERGDLFLEGRRRLGNCDAADRLELLADGADRSGEEDWLARDLARLPRQLDGP